MKRGAMPWSWAGLAMLGIALLIWWPWNSDGGLSGVSHEHREKPEPAGRQNGDAGPSAGWNHRKEDVEARIRSIFQAGPGEVAWIRVPPGKLEELLPPDWEETMPLILLDRDRAMSGLAGILRRGEALDARIDAANREIAWDGEGMTMKGEIRSMGASGEYRIRAIIGKSWEDGHSLEFVSRVKPGSVALIRPPEWDTDGVLLVFGEHDEDRGR